MNRILHSFSHIFLIGIFVSTWLNVQAQCDANFTFTHDASACASFPVQFAASADPYTVVSYSWNFGDGSFLNTSRNPEHLFPITATTTNYTVTLSVTDTSGITCNTTQTITIQGANPILATLNQPFLCASDTTVTTFNLTVTIDPTSMGLGPFTIDWGDGSAPQTAAGPTINHTYTTYGTFDLRITGNAGGCAGFYQKVFFYVDPIASVQIVGQPFVCEGNSITVRNTSDISKGNIDYFVWDWGDFGPTYTVTDTAPQTYQFNLDSIDICVGLPFSGYSDGVTLTAYNTCSDHFTFSQIKIRAKPRAEFDWPKPVCLPNALVQFTNLSCPVINYSDPANFTWIFENPGGGTSTSTLANPTFTYNQAGTYNVTLIATNNCGSDTLTKQVVVIPPPVASFVLDNTSGCINFCVTTDNQSTPSNGVNYTWDVFADTSCWDFVDTLQNMNSFEPGFCFVCTDTFPIRLTAQNVCGVDSVRDSVFAWRQPTLTIAAVDDTCGSTYVIDSIGYTVIDYGSPIINYSWTFTGGTPATFSGPNPPPVTFGPGNNSIQLCVDNDCGQTCITEDFLLAPLPTLVLDPDTSICLNDSITISGNPPPGFWSGSGIDSSGIFKADTAGNYSLIYTHLAASCQVYDTMQVTVRDTPQVQILTPFMQECLDTSLVLTLDATPAGGIWTGPNLINGNQFRADTAGTFVFQYTVPDPVAGCEGRGFATIVIDTIPVIDSIPSVVLYCSGTIPEPLPAVTPAGGVWSGSPAIVGNTFDPSLLPGPDTLMIYYTFTDGNNCSATDSMEVRVVNPSAAFAGPGDTLCYNHGIDTLAGASPAGGEWSIASGNYLLDPFSGSFNTLLMQSAGNIFTYTVFKGTSCEVSDQVSVFILDTLDVSIGPDTVVCSSDEAFTLTTTATGGVWTGLGVLNPATGLYDPGLVPPGTHDTVCYQVTALNGCLSQDCRIIYVDSLPTPGFTGPMVACIGEFLTFPITSTSAVSHQWDFGDGTGIQSNNTHTYTQANTYTITQYAFNANGCVDSVSQTIDVSEPPFADFTVDVDSGCAPLTVTFTNTSNIAGGTCFWDFGNSQTSTLCNPGAMVFEDSTDVAHYTVTLTIANLCDTVSFSREIKVFPRPQVIFDSQQDTGCSILPVQFGNLTTGQPNSFAWYLDTLSNDSLFSTALIPPTQYYRHDDSTGFSIYTVYLVATNQCGVDTGSQDIVVYPNTMDALFNTSDLQGCAPLTVTFADLSGAPFKSWEINGSFPQGDTVTYTFSQAGTYIVKHFANNGCSYDTNEVEIRVYPQPIVDFSADTLLICQGATINFFNFSQNTNSWEWDFGDMNTASTFNASHVYNQSGTFTVTLTAWADTNACSNQHTEVITVLPPPSPAISMSDTAACPPLLVNFSASPPNLNYLWDFGNGASSAQQQASNLYNMAGFYNIRLTVTDNLGCSDSTQRGILIHEQPLATFTASADTVCGPNIPITFQNTSSSTTALAYSWDFGDSSAISTQANPTHSYSATGVYQVRLICENTFGCTDTAMQTIVVLPVPQSMANVSDPNGCVPLSVSFTDSSLNSSGQQWLIDMQTFSGNTVAYTFSIPDTCYNVQLIADTAGFCMDTTQVQVCTFSPPIADFSTAWDKICDIPAQNSFTNASQSTLPLNYLWTFGDGGNSVLENPTHIFQQTGLFEVKLVVSNVYGCQDSLRDTIQVLPVPTADILATPERGCSPLDVQFTNNSSNYSGSLWAFGDNSGLSTQRNPSHTYFPTDTLFTVTLIVDTANFCFDTTQTEIRMGSTPIADFEASTYESCGPTTVSFTNRSFSAFLGMSYVWDFGNGDSSSLANPTISYTQPGLYEVQLITYNEYECSDTISRTINIIPQATALFSSDQTLTCSGYDLHFTDLSTNATMWNWTFGDGTSSTDANPTHAYSNPGLYDVQLIVTYDGKCGDTLRMDELITVWQSPIADFVATDTTFLRNEKADGHVRFTNLSFFSDRYKWSFGNGDSSDAVSPLYQYLINDAYEVTLVAYTNEGCTDTARQTLLLNGINGLHVPTALAPLTGTQPMAGNPASGDLYTVFYPRGIGLEKYHITVYTRWGELVWESTELVDGVPAAWWDGTDSKGKLMNSGVYIWHVKEAIYTDGSDYKGDRTGNVTLIR